MPDESDTKPQTESVRVALHNAMLAAFCNAMRETHLPPMMVMSLAAAAVGSVYNEVAGAHRGRDACPCGWWPDRQADVRVLQAALAKETQVLPLSDLRIAQVAGRA